MPRGVVPKSAFKKGHRRVPGAGRVKGTPNRITTSMRRALLACFQSVGGAAYLRAMCLSKNGADRRAMLQLFARLIPTEILLPAGAIDLSSFTMEELEQIRSGRVTPALAETLARAEAEPPHD